MSQLQEQLFWLIFLALLLNLLTANLWAVRLCEELHRKRRPPGSVPPNRAFDIRPRRPQL